MPPVLFWVRGRPFSVDRPILCCGTVAAVAAWQRLRAWGAGGPHCYCLTVAEGGRRRR